MNELHAPCVECGRFVTWKEAEETGQLTTWNDGKSMGAKWICPTCLWKTKVLVNERVLRGTEA